MKYIQKLLIIILAGALLLIAGYSTLQVFRLSAKSTKIKHDYSEANSITYGLLSVNIWRDYITDIVINRIDDFELTPAQSDTLTKEVTNILNAVISTADNLVEQKQTTLKGKLQKLAIRTFINKEQVFAMVPLFSRTIVAEIQKPANKEAIKFIVKSKLQEFSDSTYANTEELLYVQGILKKYDTETLEEFNKKNNITLEHLEERTYFFTYIVLGIILLFLVLWLILRNQKAVHTPLFIISVILALVVLAAGLTTPMIEIDARFKEVDFLLIGEKISFKDQIIFFQSKSILDVVRILLDTGKFDSIMVGALVLIFSIVLPIAKLLSTQLYLAGNARWRRNSIINFFAFKSGKWSMADVYVIAVFMAYIGFKGILDKQLSFMNMNTDALVSITTNETSLQPGFILFIGFVLFNLFLSVILQKMTAIRTKVIIVEEKPVRELV